MKVAPGWKLETPIFLGTGMIVFHPLCSTGQLIRKRAMIKAGWDLQENKEFGTHYTEISVERTHS